MSIRSADKIDVHVGNRIRMRRMEQKISQSELGDALDISFQQIQKYEKGINRVSASAMQKIAGALDCPISYFYENAPGKKGSGDTSEMTSFMTSSFGMQIAQAFNSLPEDGNIRRSLRDVIVGVAESHAAATSRHPRARAA